MERLTIDEFDLNMHARQSLCEIFYLCRGTSLKRTTNLSLLHSNTYRTTRRFIHSKSRHSHEKLVILIRSKFSFALLPRSQSPLGKPHGHPLNIIESITNCVFLFSTIQLHSNSLINHYYWYRNL